MNVVVSTVGIIIYIFTTLLNFYFLVYINVTFLFFLLIPSAHYQSIYWKVQTTDHTDRSKPQITQTGQNMSQSLSRVLLYLMKTTFCLKCKIISGQYKRQFKNPTKLAFWSFNSYIYCI